MKDKVTVITTTHVHSYAPSTSILKQNLDSAYKMFKNLGECSHLIYLDSKIKNQIYEDYVNNILELIKDFDNIELIDSPNSGYKFNYWHAIHTVTTPYMLFIEHDWDFLHPVDLPLLVQVFDKYNNVNLVKLPKRDNMLAMDRADRLWDFIIKPEENIPELALTKTSSFATNPHLIRVSKFLNEWKYHMYYPGSNSNSIELPLRDKYRDEIGAFGFDEIHKRWGCYNYGTPDGPKYITHLDASKSGKT